MNHVNSGFSIKHPPALCPIATKRAPGFSLVKFDTQIAFIGTKHNKTTKCYVKDGKFLPLVMPRKMIMFNRYIMIISVNQLEMAHVQELCWITGGSYSSTFLKKQDGICTWNHKLNFVRNGGLETQNHSQELYHSQLKHSFCRGCPN